MEVDKKTGLKHNCYKIQGVKGKLFSRMATVSCIRPHIKDDSEFSKIFNQWLAEGKIGQHMLAESRERWGLGPASLSSLTVPRKTADTTVKTAIDTVKTARKTADTTVKTTIHPVKTAEKTVDSQGYH